MRRDGSISQRLVLHPNLRSSFSHMSAPRPAPPPARGADQPDPRRVLGAQGEEVACKHLERLGFAILDRNVRTRHGEIDAIAFDGSTLVFAEVKTRRTHAPRMRADSASDGDEKRSGRAVTFAPLEGLRVAQRRRLRRLAAAWLQQRTASLRAEEIRFDAIGVLIDGSGELVALDHIEGAW